MELSNSSSTRLKASNCSDATNQNSLEGSELEAVSFGINGRRINNRSNNKKKTAKNLESPRFTRQARSRKIKTPIYESNDAITPQQDQSLLKKPGASANYLKETRCSQGKKSHFETSPRNSVSSFDSNDQTSTGIKKKSSNLQRLLFKPSRVFEDVNVDNATYSSTLRDSKLSECVEVHSGGSVGERSLVIKVCRYHHCSLNGHENKSSSGNKTRTIVKKQRRMKAKGESRNGTKDVQYSQMIRTSLTSKDIDLELEQGFVVFSNIGDSEAQEVVEQEIPRSDSEECGVLFNKQRHISMWHLIHQKLTSNFAAETQVEELHSTKGKKIGNGSYGFSLNFPYADMVAEKNDEIELRKLYVVKLVGEAINKILLQESQTDNEVVKTKKTVRGKWEKKPAKYPSKLQNQILPKRFIKESGKVKKLNSRKSQHLPREPGPQAEKVHLRPQTEREVKRAEEWMLDHALQQALSQFASTEKRKVALLVKAFETVLPLPKTTAMN